MNVWSMPVKSGETDSHGRHNPIQTSKNNSTQSESFETILVFRSSLGDNIQAH